MKKEGFVTPEQVDRRAAYSLQSVLRTRGLGDVAVTAHASSENAVYEIRPDTFTTGDLTNFILNNLDRQRREGRMQELARLTGIPEEIDQHARRLQKIFGYHDSKFADVLNFHPTMLPAHLREYFHKRFPKDTRKLARLSPLGYARLVAQELGRGRRASTVYVHADGLSYPYVVPHDAQPDDFAYNNTNLDDKNWPLTVREVRAHGKDITGTVMKSLWSAL